VATRLATGAEESRGIPSEAERIERLRAEIDALLD
jgi:hypothetical protein